MFQGQNGEILSLSPGKLGFFLIVALFFHPSLPKIEHSTQLKTTFSNKYGTGYPLKKFHRDKLEITVSISSRKKNCFESRTMVTKQKIFDQLLPFMRL